MLSCRLLQSAVAGLILLACGVSTLAHSPIAIGNAAGATGSGAPAAAQAPCTYELNPPSAHLDGTAQTRSLSVRVVSGSGCAWTATTNHPAWLQIVSGASGVGDGTVVYAVTENRSYWRDGVLVIAGENYSVTQESIACDITLSPSSVSVRPQGGTGTIAVTTVPSCDWFAYSIPPWDFLGALGGGSGAGTFSYRVYPNVRGARRVGYLAVGTVGASRAHLTVDQAGRGLRADFHGDGRADFGVFRPSSGTWIVQWAADAQLGQAGDIPVPGDYDGDGVADRAVYRASEATWLIADSAPVQFGQVGDVPVPADYDFDGTTDIAVFRTVLGYGQWYIRGQGGPFVLGRRGDIPVPEDYDRDGKADLAVFRPTNGTWYIATAASGFATITSEQFGLGGYGDVPVPGNYNYPNGAGRAGLAIFRAGCVFIDYQQGVQCGVSEPPNVVPMAIDNDGDGREELVLFEPSTGQWCRLYGGSSPYTCPSPSESLGGPGDIPVAQRPRIAHVNPTDFDGDGTSDMTVFTSSTGTWSTRLSHWSFAAVQSQTLGQAGDIKVPGDYDGDHRADAAVWRPSDGTWQLHFSAGASPRTIAWGLPGDTPVPADYDGDGRTDLAVWRPADGVWYILDSSSDYQAPRAIQWGLGLFDDTPVPGDYDGDGKVDVAVYRPEPGLWFLKLSSGSDVVQQWGLGVYDDVPLVGDFDGDGRAEITVFRPAWGLWFSMDPLTGVPLPVQQFGLPGDIPLVEDFDGDGITDLSVYRPNGNFWYMQRSTLGFYGPVQWGLSSDEPLLRPRETTVSRTAPCVAAAAPCVRD